MRYAYDYKLSTRLFVISVGVCDRRLCVCDCCMIVYDLRLSLFAFVSGVSVIWCTM